MAKKIIWTPEAIQSFQKTIEYLLENWSEREVENFVSKTDNIIEIISHQPYLYRQSIKIGFREAVVTKQNILVYIIKEDRIDLISFWDARQNPRRKLKLLKNF